MKKRLSNFLLNMVLPSPSSPTGQDLWNAAYQNRVDDVRAILLQHNPQLEVNWQDPSIKRTPFLRSCYFGHVDIVKMLLKDPRTDVNLVQSQGATPFYLACQEGHLEVVQLLIADPRIHLNHPADDGMTPFFSAVKGGHLHVVQWLLALCPQIDALTLPPGHYFFRRTPADVARLDGHEALADLLDQYLKDPVAMRTMLLRTLQIKVRMVANLFALVVLLSDGYLSLSPEPEPAEDPEGVSDRLRRFYGIARRLPIEMQMVLCNRAYGESRDLVSAAATEDALKNVIAQIYESHLLGDI